MEIKNGDVYDNEVDVYVVFGDHPEKWFVYWFGTDGNRQTEVLNYDELCSYIGEDTHLGNIADNLTDFAYKLKELGE